MIHYWDSAGVIISILLSLLARHVLPLDYPNATLSATWINNRDLHNYFSFADASWTRPILVRGSGHPISPGYACGFFGNDNGGYLFSVFIAPLDIASNLTKSEDTGNPQVVWSANRNYPVKANATVQLTAEGNLLLRDVDGVLVWSTNTKGRSVAGLSLTDTGNLILFDLNNSAVWQSFHHPTDSLVPAQELFTSIKLRASVSHSNWSEGLYSFSVDEHGYTFAVGSNPQRVYLQKSSTAIYLSIPPNNSADHYLKLGPDGHMRHYEYVNGWRENGEFLTGGLTACQFPLVCGEYGICRSGQCSCPSYEYFQQADDRQPNLGCLRNTPLTCNASSLHMFVEITRASYFTFDSDINNTDPQRCKEACLANCSCKAVIFRFGLNASHGDCYLAFQIYSLMDISEDHSGYNFSVFLKVQATRSRYVRSSSHKSSFSVIFGSILGALLLLAIGF